MGGDNGIAALNRGVTLPMWCRKDACVCTRVCSLTLSRRRMKEERAEDRA